ncbi:MAG: DNA polymerase/3'-5' exonuclease PolX [Candidatus Eremiobacteraeota bacterium]|nr:DNA polymerase/3'-5' exonuclease PolX [Candidatus Eremiobacteraeota bacterium]MCW5866909.1 DNA polymerase/3'-5' exonuclease PolX [Candidatus Eremiobacteraeota bacterium]
MAFEDNQQLTRIFEEIADFLELQGENIFKVKAYQKAARGLEGLERSVSELYRSGALASMPGFGKALVEKVGQFVDRGEVELHQQLKSSFPPEILHLMDVPGLGAKKAALLYKELGIGSVDALEKALREGLVTDIKGFGTKTVDKLLEGIGLLRQGEQRWLLGRVSVLAEELLARLRALPVVQRAEAAGSLRRGKETVGDLDLLVISSAPEQVMEFFAGLGEVIGSGPTKTSIRWEGTFQIDLRCVPAESFGAALQYFTGSMDHNVALRGRARRMSCELNEYGLFDALGQCIASETEEEIYAKLGLPWIAPELRESGAELEWERQPERLELGKLQGNLHTHSLWSDGTDTLEQLAEEAQRRGYRYLAVTDHSRSMVVANGLTVERLLAQGEEIARLNRNFKNFRLLWGSEVDILGDGTLDFPEEILARLDFVVVAVHSQFSMSPEAMTERICRGISHPHVDVLAHPSGRKINRRAGYQADWERVYAVAREHGVALEINCSPRRLDLNDKAARRARDCGCLISLGTDAHSLPEFDYLPLGVLQARRAGIEASSLLNSLSWEQLRKRRPHLADV